MAILVSYISVIVKFELEDWSVNEISKAQLF